ncbi:LCP family protein [Actinomadura sp. LOL_016]|uniref:LCP family glycopolymer transferase n=1 Tax=unclassified Actinomadura TaxID=2626254 RepID=UPI003A7F8E55
MIDAELIESSLTDPESFAALFDRYAAMLYRYVSRRLGPEAAEDVVGETFLAAFGGRHRYDLSRPDARPWLFGIATKLVARHHRAEAARYRALRRSPVDGAVEGPAEQVADGVTAAAVLVPMLFSRGGERAGPVAETRAPETGGFNLLLIGSDARGDDASRSDTLMLLHVPKGRGGVRVVSFPRDLIVEVPPCGGAPGTRKMINSAFTTGGAECVWKTVESLTDVRIDRAVTVGFDGFRTVVDALGGVEVRLPEPVVDRKAGLSLPAGRQRLDGTRALAYVRARYSLGDGTDLSRIRRQHVFLTSMAGRIVELREDPVAFARFVKAVAGAVETVPALDAAGLLELARSMAKVGTDDVEFGTVPVLPTRGGPGRVEIDGERAERLFAQLRTG